ncbi:hypothetical protein P7C70_g4604, partial [Phenoliferia sp. Uapishka_3]
MHFSTVTIFLACTSLTLGGSIPIETALARRAALPVAPSDFHSTTRPRRIRKHHQATPKRSSAAGDRAKRFISPTPIFDEIEERALDLLDGVGALAGLGAIPVVGSLGERQLGGLGGLGAIPTTGNGLGFLDITALLTSCTSGMSTHQAKIQKLASRARNYKDSPMNSKFQNSVYEELKAYRGSAAGLPGLQQLDATLKPIAPNQGLGEFDRNNDIEVLFRTISTSFQDTLESVNLIGERFSLIFVCTVDHLADLVVLFNSLQAPHPRSRPRPNPVSRPPSLPPFALSLFPTQYSPRPSFHHSYDIKCIIDDLLNIVQLLLDGTLNGTGIGSGDSALGSSPLGFSTLSGNYLTSVCKMGPSLPAC